jgi:GGDEF domain-containing protein
MNRKLFILFILIVIYSCKNTKNNNYNSIAKLESSDSVIKRVSTLFQIEIEQNYVLSKIDEERFILALPNNFDEFVLFYGRRYQLKDGRRLFLSPDYHYFTLLPNLFYIDKKYLTEKLIQISLNGNFDENRQISSMDSDSVSFLSNLIDATAVFQKSIQLYFASNVTTTCQVMKNLNNNEVLSFWNFYFYSPHPENYREDFEELQNRFIKYDKRITQLMKQSYEKLLSEHDGHGH